MGALMTEAPTCKIFLFVTCIPNPRGVTELDCGHCVHVLTVVLAYHKIALLQFVWEPLAITRLHCCMYVCA